MKKNIPIFILSVLFVSLFLSACNGVGAQVSNLTRTVPFKAANQMIENAASPQPQIGSENELLAAYQNTLSTIYEQVSPSVVNIRVVQNQSQALMDLGQLPGLPELPFFNQPDSQNPHLPGESGPESPMPAQGLGSGFIWDQEGHIVTNNHVVEGADKIEVRFSDGKILSAKLVGADPDSDLAVIKVDGAADELIPVQMADSNQVKVGQLAIAIGNPFGLEGTMTVGIVSALGRSLPVGEGLLSGPAYSIPDIIQTDAPINPGNSGGVLLNSEGRVIGVTAAIESPVRANAGIGFVIPSAIVKKVVPALISAGQYEHPWIGISALSLTPDLAKVMDLDLEQRGALVASVSPDSPAEKAGLQGSEQSATIDGQEINVGGDVIVGVDGQTIQEMGDLIAFLARDTAVGQTIQLEVIRDGKIRQIELKLVARPDRQAKQNQPKSESPKQTWLGIAGLTLNDEIANELGSEQAEGVLVMQVEPKSPAHTAGLQGGSKPVTVNGEEILTGGDIIIAVDDRSVESIEGLREILQKHSPGDEIALTIIREGNQQVLKVTLGERPAGNP